MSRILVCDDDDEFALMMSTFLKSLGHSIVRASNPGQMAAALLREKPDLLVTDLDMPGGGGGAGARFLLSIGADALPVIVCSGSPVGEQVQFFTGLKRVRYFQKPVNLDEVERAVKEQLVASR